MKWMYQVARLLWGNATGSRKSTRARRTKYAHLATWLAQKLKATALVMAYQGAFYFPYEYTMMGEAIIPEEDRGIREARGRDEAAARAARIDRPFTRRWLLSSALMASCLPCAKPRRPGCCPRDGPNDSYHDSDVMTDDE